MKRNSCPVVFLSLLVVFAAHHASRADDERTGDLLDLLKSGQYILASREVSGTYEIVILTEKRAEAFKRSTGRGRGVPMIGVVVRVGRDHVIVKYEPEDEKSTSKTKAIALNAINSIVLQPDDGPTVKP